jgi:hypothetical protein
MYKSLNGEAALLNDKMEVYQQSIVDKQQHWLAFVT